MSKNVQIPESLFTELARYFLLDVRDRETEEAIIKGLTAKMDAMEKRNLYSQYKTAPSPEQREKARTAYLDNIGMRESFRQ